jgi:hypothetical protein
MAPTVQPLLTPTATNDVLADEQSSAQREGRTRRLTSTAMATPKAMAPTAALAHSDSHCADDSDSDGAVDDSNGADDSDIDSDSSDSDGADDSDSDGADDAFAAEPNDGARSPAASPGGSPSDSDNSNDGPGAALSDSAPHELSHTDADACSAFYGSAVLRHCQRALQLLHDGGVRTSAAAAAAPDAGVGPFPLSDLILWPSASTRPTWPSLSVARPLSTTSAASSDCPHAPSPRRGSSPSRLAECGVGHTRPRTGNAAAAIVFRVLHCAGGGSLQVASLRSCPKVFFPHPCSIPFLIDTDYSMSPRALLEVL